MFFKRPDAWTGAAVLVAGVVACSSKLTTKTAGTGIAPAAEEGAGGESEETGATNPDKTPPVAGKFTVTTGISATAFVLNWEPATDDVTNPAKLRYLVCTGPSAAEIATPTGCRAATVVNDYTAKLTSVSLGDRVPETTYFFNVVVSDDAGNEASYDGVEVRTSGQVDATPPVPGSLQSPIVTATSITLNWTAALDAVTSAADLEYQVCTGASVGAISTVQDCEAATVAAPYAKAATTLTLTGMASLTTYYFNVVVKDAAGNKAVYGSTSVATDAAADTTPPGAGAFAVSTSVTDTGFTLHWTAATDAGTATSSLEYLVCSGVSPAAIDSVGKCEGATVEMAYSAATLALDVIGRVPSTTYHYNVVVRDLAGHRTLYAGLSQATTATPPVPGPICFDQATNSVATANDVIYYGGNFTRANTCFGPGFPVTTSTGALAVNSATLAKPDGAVYAVTDDGAGGWFIGGAFTDVDGQPAPHIAHVLASGAFDTAWTPPAFDQPILDLARSGSTLYVAGSFGSPRKALAALNAGTGALKAWNPLSLATGTVQVNEVEVAGTTVYAAGTFKIRHAGVRRENFAGFDGTTGLPVGWEVCAGTGVTAMAAGSTHLYTAGFTEPGRCTGDGVPIDATTGSLAVSYQNLAQVDGMVLAVIPDAVGGWYIGGNFAQVGTTAQAYLAHILADGSLDPAFNPVLNNTVWALFLDGGTLYVGGGFSQINGSTRTFLGAVDATTGAAQAWNPAPSNFVTALFKDGSTVYVGGGFSSIGGASRTGVAAVSATTGLATAFNASASCVSTCSISRLVVSGTSLYVAGNITSIGGQARANLAEVNAGTGVATAWNPNPNNRVEDFVIDGTVAYLIGQFNSVGAGSRNRLAAVSLATGSATAWNPAPDNTVTGLALNGTKLYVAGNFYNVAGQPRRSFAAFDTTTGSLAAFDPKVSGSSTARLAATASAVYLGMNLSCINCPVRRSAAIDLSDGSLTAWDAQANGDVKALVPSGSVVYAGGVFSNIGGANRQHLAALDATTGLAGSWNPGTSGTVTALALDGTDVLVGGLFNFAGIGSPARNNLARLDGVTGVAKAWDPHAYGSPNRMMVQGPSVFLVGSVGSVGGPTRQHLAALDAPTGDMLPWNPATDGSVQVVEAAASSVFVGGTFANAGGQPRSHLAELDVVTGLATPWNPDADGTVTTLAVTPTTVFAGGDFTAIGGESRIRLAALDRSTGLALAGWDPAPDGQVSSLFASGTVLHVGGGFANVAATPMAYFATLDQTNASLQGPDLGLDGSVSGIFAAPDPLYLSGSFGNPTRSGAFSGGASTGWTPEKNWGGALQFEDGHFIAADQTGHLTATDLLGNPTVWDFSLNAGYIADVVAASFKVYVAGSFESFSGPSASGAASNALALPGVCRAGYYCPPGSTDAQGSGACDPGHYCPTGSTTAAGSGVCSAGFYCPAGSGKLDGALCADGYFCPSGSSSATGNGPCPAGSYCVGGSPPGPCDAGYACMGGDNNSMGTGPCPAGYYCQSGMQPQLCTAGSFCLGSNSSPTGDGSCDAGFYCPAGSSSSTGQGACSPGYYCPSGSSSSTEALCAGGYYCPGGDTMATGSGLCADGYFCPPGSSSSTGSGTCTAGYYCPSGSESATQYSCGLGSYCPAGSASPTSCQATNNATFTNPNETMLPCAYTCNSGFPTDNGLGDCSP